MYRVQKKRKGFLFYFFLFLCAFSVGLGIGYGVIEKRIKDIEGETQVVPVREMTLATQPPAEAQASLNMVVELETPAPQPAYFVITQDDSVCVFSLNEKGEKRFSHKLGILLEELPAVDQKLFEEGFYLYSKQELLELIEDFSS